MTHILLRAATVAGAVLLALAVHAMPVTVGFAGTVTQAPNVDPANPWPGVLEVGTSFAGWYTIDDATPDAVPDAAATGSYTDPLGTFAIDFGAPSFLGLVGASPNVGVGNDYAGGTDFYTLLVTAGGDGATVTITLVDFDGAALASDALPRVASLPSFEVRDFALMGPLAGPAGDPLQVEILGRVDTLACLRGCGTVPEPSASALLCIGLATLAAGFQRTRRGTRRVHDGRTP